MRDDIYRLKARRDLKGREQRGQRLCVVVQSDAMPLSTWLVAPTSTSAKPATFRPEIDVAGQSTLILVEQTTAIDPQRLGDHIGRLSISAMQEVDTALKTMLDLP